MIKELFKTYYEKYGKEISGFEMDNGEYRFRLSSADSAYIRTESNGGGWQNSHYHTEQTEYFLVEKGVIKFAVFRDDQVIIHDYGAGEFFFVPPMVPHNMCLSKGGITHTVKFGGRPDWNSYLVLDEHLKGWREK